MKTLIAGCAVAALLALAAGGCILTSGQIQLHFELPNLTATSANNIIGEAVDLNEEEDYADNKEDLQDISDLAVLGKITNHGGNAIHVEVWMTRDLTSYTTETALKADSEALPLWGPFALAGAETKQIDWDDSAALFSEAGKAVLLEEAKGDGTFTIYAIGVEGTYSFSVEHGALVLEIDIGI